MDRQSIRDTHAHLSLSHTHLQKDPAAQISVGIKELSRVLNSAMYVQYVRKVWLY